LGHHRKQIVSKLAIDAMQLGLNDRSLAELVDAGERVDATHSREAQRVKLSSMIGQRTSGAFVSDKYNVWLERSLNASFSAGGDRFLQVHENVLTRRALRSAALRRDVEVVPSALNDLKPTPAGRRATFEDGRPVVRRSASRRSVRLDYKHANIIVG
jgi:hypothetical protein